MRIMAAKRTALAIWENIGRPRELLLQATYRF
jgi:hypothetical protein